DTLAARGFHVLAPDLPGHGRSMAIDAADDLPYSLDWIGAMLIQFGCKAVRCRGGSRFAVVAHSLAAGAVVTWLSHFAATGAEPPSELAGVLALSVPSAVRVHWLLRGASSRRFASTLPWLLDSPTGGLFYRRYIATVCETPGLRDQLFRLYDP